MRSAKRYSSDGLTFTELEIVKLLAEGKTLKEIATIPGKLKTINTVEAHVYNIYAKWNVHNRVELIRVAVEKGVVKLNMGGVGTGTGGSSA